MLRVVLTVCAPVLLLGLASCGEETAGGNDRLRVVATTGQAADFAREVGGARVDVSGLLAPNADPHEFEIRPDDVKELSDAKLVVRSGGDLDDWLDGAIDNSGADAQVLTLADHVALDDDDPHWWQDPRNAIAAVAALRDALIEADPAGADAYRRNARAYTERLERLDAAVRRASTRSRPPTARSSRPTTRSATTRGATASASSAP
jgi:ABC-type Zn uptake system ZnuABC Zn-binding protein ZnuA